MAKNQAMEFSFEAHKKGMFPPVIKWEDKQNGMFRIVTVTPVCRRITTEIIFNSSLAPRSNSKLHFSTNAKTVEKPT